MPRPIVKRDVILKTSVAAGTVSDLNLSMDASFSTDLSGTTITYEDESNDKKEEKTKYRVVFTDPGAGAVGSITLKFVGSGNSDVGATTTRERADYRFDPPGRVGNVVLPEVPAHSFERIWKQNVRDGRRTEIVDNVAKLDVRVLAERGYAVTQTLTSTSDEKLVLTYEWAAVGGRGVVTGTVTLQTSATAGSDFVLGPIRITDNNSGDVRRVRVPQ